MRKKMYKNRGLIFGIIALLLASCSGVDSDARKAAVLTNKSIEQTQEMRLDEARKTYRQAQKIIGKYKKHKKSEAFGKRYQEYRDKGKLPLRGE
jgi:hypothetical protein